MTWPWVALILGLVGIVAAFLIGMMWVAKDSKNSEQNPPNIV